MFIYILSRVTFYNINVYLELLCSLGKICQLSQIAIKNFSQPITLNFQKISGYNNQREGKKQTLF